jgi:hypothetical protein
MAATARGAVVAAVVAAAAVACGVVVIVHSGEEVYGIPGWGVGLTVALVAVSLAGCAVVARVRQPGFSAVVLACAAFVVLGMLAVFSFGLLALLVAVGLLRWALSGRWSGPLRGRAAVGAVLAGAPLPVLVIFAAAGPLVDCDVDGVSGGENVFLGLGSDGGSATATGDGGGSASGRVEGGGYAYSYTCRDGQLVRFDMRWR